MRRVSCFKLQLRDRQEARRISVGEGMTKTHTDGVEVELGYGLVRIF